MQSKECEQAHLQHVALHFLSILAWLDYLLRYFETHLHLHNKFFCKYLQYISQMLVFRFYLLFKFLSNFCNLCSFSPLFLSEMVLRYCESPSVGTCCTYNMETRMALQSRVQLEKQSKEQITKMSNALAAKAQKFNSE